VEDNFSMPEAEHLLGHAGFFIDPQKVFHILLLKITSINLIKLTNLAFSARLSCEVVSLKISPTDFSDKITCI